VVVTARHLHRRLRDAAQRPGDRARDEERDDERDDESDRASRGEARRKIEPGRCELALRDGDQRLIVRSRMESGWSDRFFFARRRREEREVAIAVVVRPLVGRTRRTLGLYLRVLEGEDVFPVELAGAVVDDLQIAVEEERAPVDLAGNAVHI